MIRPYKNISPVWGSHCYIDAQATVIGKVTLGHDVSVWPMAVIRGDVHDIQIGDKTNIQDGAILHVAHQGPYSPGYPLIIGEGVTVGHQAVLHACQVGNYCLIGINAIVLDGAVIEDYVMLGANSLVPPGKTLKSKHLYLGSPAKCIRPLTEEEIEKLKYSAEHYVKIKNDYLAFIA
jgi:carbonic anhydrase/acetyltransferase-like protein (isoleucine patch superfamily)